MSEGVDFVTHTVKTMREHWRPLNALRNGTIGMRIMKSSYLPQNPGESETAYTARLNRTFLFPAYDVSVRNVASKPFTRPVYVNEKSPSQVHDWSKNMDLEGTDITNFAAQAFDKAIDRGVMHALTDVPITLRRGRSPLSLGEERAMGLRPYAILVPPDNILGWRTERLHGVEVLTQLRILEQVWIEKDEYGEELVDRVRVYNRELPRAPSRKGAKPFSGKTTWHLYERKAVSTSKSLMFNGTNQGNNKSWVEVDNGVVSLNRIPLRSFYTKQTGFMSALPPLEDLGWLNIAHWQSSSDQRHILHVARVPILWGAGWQKDDFQKEDGKPMEIGSNRFIVSSEANAKLAFAEHTGSAIEAGRRDLLDLKEEMTALALRPFVERDRTIFTATEASLRASDQAADLSLWAASLEIWLERILDDMSEWMKAPSGAKVEVWDDFGAMRADITELGNARLRGDITREVYFKELQRRSILDDDWNFEEHEKSLEKEKKAAIESSPPSQNGSTPQNNGNGSKEPAEPDESEE